MSGRRKRRENVFGDTSAAANDTPSSNREPEVATVAAPHRCADSGSLLLSTPPVSRTGKVASGPALSTAATTAAGATADAEVASMASTTSDVNSDDDAASIVSRLSQIVVEQEERLLGFSPTAAGGGGGGGGGQASGHASDPSPASPKQPTTRAPTPTTTTLGMSRSRSASGHVAMMMSQQYVSPPGRRSNENTHDDLHPYSPEADDSFPLNEPVPEIHVINDDEPAPADKLGHRRPATKSKSSSRLPGARQRPENASLRTRNAESPPSSGLFQPERGNLRRLGSSSRNYELPVPPLPSQAAQPAASGHRFRSETISTNVDRTKSAENQSNLIMFAGRRSTWTLSEFEQAFNKLGAGGGGENGEPDDSLAHSTLDMLDNMNAAYNGGSGGAAGSDQPAPSGIERQPSSQNLLMLASKNAVNMSQQLTAPSAATSMTMNCGDMNNNNNNKLNQHDNYLRQCQQHQPVEGRTSGMSHAHSIVSLASSFDSFYATGVGKSVSRGLPKVTRKRRAAKRGDRRSAGARRRGDDAADGDGDADSHSSKCRCGSCRLACLRSCCSLTTFSQYLPILEWLPRYKAQFLWGDLMAGLAVAVLNISTSLSAAVVAETDLGVAFRASIVNTLVYAMLCSSRHTSFGSWSIMSQMLLVSVRRALADELILDRLNMGPATTWDPVTYERWHLNIIIMYTFLIGLIQLLAGVLNLGTILASFIPEALCSSMIAATAFSMAIGQLANMCGTSNKILHQIERNSTETWTDSNNPPPIDITYLFAGLFRWMKQICLIVKHHDQINTACLIISVVSVIILFFNQFFVQKQLERLFKRKIFVPSEMILLIVMIIVSYSLDLNGRYGVPTTGPIHIDFVIPGLPNLHLIRELWFQSLATALISYTMVYIMAKTYSNKLNYEVDCNQELIACGAGNLIGGLFDALPATASFSRTAGQVEAGGNTQMASIINCIALVVVAQLLGHHVAVLPICVMSATLFYGFVRMMTRFSEALMYWRLCKVDFAIWLVTCGAILTLDMVSGFIYGFIFSILTMLYRAQNRRCYMLGTIGITDVYVPLVKYPLAQEIEGIKIFQFCGPIHYVCADLFERLLRQKTRVNVKQIVEQQICGSRGGGDVPGAVAKTDGHQQEVATKFNPRDMNLPTHIILDFSMISYIDSAGIHVIKKIIEDYQRINVTILLASLASHVATVVKSDPPLWNAYKERFYVTLAGAVERAIRDSRLQQSIAASNAALKCG